MRGRSASKQAQADQISGRVSAWHAEMTDEQRAARAAAISAGTRLAMAAKESGKKIRLAKAGRALTDAELAVLRKMSEGNRKRAGRIECPGQTNLL